MCFWGQGSMTQWVNWLCKKWGLLVQCQSGVSSGQILPPTHRSLQAARRASGMGGRNCAWLPACGTSLRELSLLHFLGSELPPQVPSTLVNLTALLSPCCLFGILSSLAETKLILGAQGELKTCCLASYPSECDPCLQGLIYPSFSASSVGITRAGSGSMLAFTIMSFMNQVGFGWNCHIIYCPNWDFWKWKEMLLIIPAQQA